MKFVTKIAKWFPSPQIGSELEELEQEAAKLRSFHPLKSGRNRLEKRCSREEKQVSIPSSRVGTCSFVKCRGHRNSCFHPLKSGRNGMLYLRANDSAPRFHPLKSGRNQADEILKAVKSFSFHPLKSGRNLACWIFRSVNLRVSIPSSRVGTCDIKKGCA